MTIKEKAEQLINEFSDSMHYEGSVTEAAIKHVELMLSEFKEIEYHYGFHLIDYLSYWNRVKQELEKM